MKLILKEYLASLRERDELEVILPDLLSQCGLNVFSRPGRGTRQDGVDVGAVGSLEGGPEKVYLFSIKAGNLTRTSWNGDAIQALRPSLDEIIDAYIPHRLPVEHREKDIVICVALGGDVREQVRPQLAGFFAKNSDSRISFQEWNGDKLADLILTCFLREDLLPEHARASLRKSLAVVDEPDASYRHFASLLRSLATVEMESDADRVTCLRQMSICLWVLFAWAREAENVEAAYLSSEVTLLHGWRIVSLQAASIGKVSQSVENAFFSIFSAYQQICGEFLAMNVLPHVDKRHGISSAVLGASGLDVNLKLFDLLGRLSTAGLWAFWAASRCSDGDEEAKQRWLHEAATYASSVTPLVLNNPALLLPVKDDQAIDVLIATALLALDERNRSDIQQWHAEMLKRARFTYETYGNYPCILQSYDDLLSHPKAHDSEYRENVTSASVLYPMIALWAALLDEEDTYKGVADFKQDLLQHCNFQFWYPDECSEAHFYTNDGRHGAVLSDVCVDRPADELLTQVFGECGQSSHFEELSAIKFNWWPLIVVACRHYRLPLPLHFLKGQVQNRDAKGNCPHAPGATPAAGEPEGLECNDAD